MLYEVDLVGSDDSGSCGCGDHCDAWMLSQVADLRLQSSRTGDVIAVEPRNKLAARVIQAGVAGVRYPAVMFVTGDSDTRVDPLHARKMAALLQASTGSANPILLRYETSGGHTGSGQP